MLALEQPGAASQLGIQLTGPLKRCRRVKLGSAYRMVYKVRETDVVIVAIGLRKDEQVYADALKALAEVTSVPPGNGGKRPSP